jgi:hypothetical protein
MPQPSQSSVMEYRPSAFADGGRAHGSPPVAREGCNPDAAAPRASLDQMIQCRGNGECMATVQEGRA